MNRFVKNKSKNVFSLIILVILIVTIIAPSVLSVQQGNIKNLNNSKNSDINSQTSSNNPTVSMLTSMGSIRIELYRDLVPNTVNNFIKLIDTEFYNGLVFHKVNDGFIIQGGGYYSNGTLKQSPFGTINLEIHPEVRHVDGAIAMAHGSDPNSASCQFYICDGAQPSLDDQYAVFGKVLDGSMGFIKDISEVPTNQKHGHPFWPVNDVLIEYVTVEESISDMEVLVRGGFGGFTAVIKNKWVEPYHHKVRVEISVKAGGPNPLYNFYHTVSPPILPKKPVRYKTIKENFMLGFKIISIDMGVDLDDDGHYDDNVIRSGLLIGPFVVMVPTKLKV